MARRSAVVIAAKSSVTAGISSYSFSIPFSPAETDLLAEILSGYEFDVVQQQALVQVQAQLRKRRLSSTLSLLM